jgi:hypothetical protein
MTRRKISYRRSKRCSVWSSLVRSRASLMLRPTTSRPARIRCLLPDSCYCQTVAGLLIRGAVPDERTGLSFTAAAGARQRNNSRVRVPWDSRPYFTISESRIPFSSSTTTRRATVEVFDSASTQV